MGFDFRVFVFFGLFVGLGLYFVLGIGLLFSFFVEPLFCFLTLYWAFCNIYLVLTCSFLLTKIKYKTKGIVENWRAN